MSKKKKDIEEKKEKNKDENIIKDAKKAESPEESNDYEFIREKIKERPINKKKLTRKMLLTAGSAVLFGLIACVTILVLEPVLSKMINNGSKKDDVTLTKIELAENEEPKVEDMDVEIDSTPYEQGPDYEEVPIGDFNYEDTVSVNTISVNETTVIEKKVSVNLEDYQILNKKMYALSEEVSKSLVTVTSVRTDTDLLQDTYRSTNTTTGIIVAENPFDLLILARCDGSPSIESVRVTFNNGISLDANMKAKDEDTGLAIYAIKLSDIPKETKGTYSIATLGTSSSGIITGTPVVVVGDPMNTGNSVCYGSITSATVRVGHLDASYQVLSTDIYGSTKGHGVLVNMRGQIIGLMTNKHGRDEFKNLVWAYGMNGIKGLIEDMSNGTKRSKLGLYVADVPSDAKEAKGMSGYIYVTKVEMDTPAMDVGIVAGDVIISINGEKVANSDDYTKKIANFKPGETVEIVYERWNSTEYKERIVVAELVAR